jgi:hypothetical protein
VGCNVDFSRRDAAVATYAGLINRIQNVKR